MAPSTRHSIKSTRVSKKSSRGVSRKGAASVRVKRSTRKGVSSSARAPSPTTHTKKPRNRRNPTMNRRTPAQKDVSANLVAGMKSNAITAKTVVVGSTGSQWNPVLGWSRGNRVEAGSAPLSALPSYTLYHVAKVLSLRSLRSPADTSNPAYALYIRDELEAHPEKRQLCVVDDMPKLSVSPSALTCDPTGDSFSIKLKNNSAIDVIYRIDRVGAIYTVYARVGFLKGRASLTIPVTRNPGKAGNRNIVIYYAPIPSGVTDVSEGWKLALPVGEVSVAVTA